MAKRCLLPRAESVSTKRSPLCTRCLANCIHATLGGNTNPILYIAERSHFDAGRVISVLTASERVAFGVIGARPPHKDTQRVGGGARETFDKSLSLAKPGEG